ncbi:hypothetical protein M2G69_20250 [Vibrio vulnificus]|uniref:hypothetical protein n=1 Tax=Vibrio vulnificus TaxID=672 RepID=UPI0019D4D7F3|nr:hypothetical protein [Vibrio vulnificus]EJT0553371.1 hypothetical protein [Vibrio vulnificus]MBN8085146.1 hypothetical protein [Vibrio vulnificus]MBN8111314.1 hypothetical protein [Vibrio vulnificus]MBN8128105.1 hypothetical protein [Vibrio vulnificus]MBN8133407.1 hypothetical protein [Vibrio vulnificus]
MDSRVHGNDSWWSGGWYGRIAVGSVNVALVCIFANFLACSFIFTNGLLLAC